MVTIEDDHWDAHCHRPCGAMMLPRHSTCIIKVNYMLQEISFEMVQHVVFSQQYLGCSEYQRLSSAGDMQSFLKL